MATTRQNDGNGINSAKAQSASSSEGGMDIVKGAKDSAGEVLNQAKEKLSEVAGQAQNEAKSQLAERKDQLADGMNSVAAALQHTSEQLQGQDSGKMGIYVSKAAGKLSDLSNYVRQNDIDHLLHEVEGFARREPALMLGGAFALGIIAARFVKSSNHRRFRANRENGEGDRRGQPGYSSRNNGQSNQGNQGRAFQINGHSTESDFGGSGEAS